MDCTSREHLFSNRVHRIGLFVCFGIVGIGLVGSMISGFSFRTHREQSVQDAVLKIARAWKAADLKPSMAPWTTKDFDRVAARVNVLASTIGPLKRLNSVTVMADHLDPDNQDEPRHYRNEGKWLNGTILASLVGEFQHGKAMFIIGLRRTKWGMEVVAISPNLIYKESNPSLSSRAKPGPV